MPTLATPIGRLQGRCFVIQPFDNGGTYDKRYSDTFKGAIEHASLEPYRVDHDPGVEVLIEDIEKGIRDADICFAEITSDNPNVWFELGYAFAINKPVCMVCSTERVGKFPFDVQHRSIIRYAVASQSDFVDAGKAITRKLTALLQKQRSIETIDSLKPTAITKGITPHEIAVLALIMAEFDSPEGVSPAQLKRDMRQAGYTEVATGLAIEKLFRSGFITQSITTDEYSQGEYPVWQLTESGKDWLLANENSLNLKKEQTVAEKEQHFDASDIPF